MTDNDKPLDLKAPYEDDIIINSSIEIKFRPGWEATPLEPRRILPEGHEVPQESNATLQTAKNLGEPSDSCDSDVDHEMMILEIKNSIAPEGLVKKILADSVKLNPKYLSTEVANLSSF